MAQKAFLGRISDVDIRLLRVFRAVVACAALQSQALMTKLAHLFRRASSAMEMRT